MDVNLHRSQKRLQQVEGAWDQHRSRKGTSESRLDLNSLSAMSNVKWPFRELQEAGHMEAEMGSSAKLLEPAQMSVSKKWAKSIGKTYIRTQSRECVLATVRRCYFLISTGGVQGSLRGAAISPGGSYGDTSQRSFEMSVRVSLRSIEMCAAWGFKSLACSNCASLEGYVELFESAEGSRSHLGTWASTDARGFDISSLVWTSSMGGR